jgi:hypothetical protein
VSSELSIPGGTGCRREIFAAAAGRLDTLDEHGVGRASLPIARGAGLLYDGRRRPPAPPRLREDEEEAFE